MFEKVYVLRRKLTGIKENSKNVAVF